MNVIAGISSINNGGDWLDRTETNGNNIYDSRNVNRRTNKNYVGSRHPQ